MHDYETKPELIKILGRIHKRDKVVYEAVMKKIIEIINSGHIEHYKNLKYDMKNFKRVHIGSFVLIFSYEKSTNFISFHDFNHHDIIYKR